MRLAGRTFRLEPSVNVRRSGGLGSSTRFSLDGLSGERVRFFMDGVPLTLLRFDRGLVMTVPYGEASAAGCAGCSRRG